MKHGSILIYSLLIMSVILAISLSLNAAFLRNLGNIREAQDSVRALYAADGGVEFCLYEARTGTRATAFLDSVQESSDCSLIHTPPPIDPNTPTGGTNLNGGTNQPQPTRTQRTQSGPECSLALPPDEGGRSASFKIADLANNESNVFDCTQFLNVSGFNIRTTGTFGAANRSLEIAY